MELRTTLSPRLCRAPAGLQHVVVASARPVAALPSACHALANKERWPRSGSVTHGWEPCRLNPACWWPGEPPPAERMEQKCPICITDVCLFPAPGNVGAIGHAKWRRTGPPLPLLLNLTQSFAFPKRFRSSGSSWLDESGFTSTAPALAELQEHSSSSVWWVTPVPSLPGHVSTGTASLLGGILEDAGGQGCDMGTGAGLHRRRVRARVQEC